MNKYLLMLSAAALIAAAPLYYAVTAQAGDMTGGSMSMGETTSLTDVETAPVDCTKVALDGEPLPAECQSTAEEISPAPAAEAVPAAETAPEMGAPAPANE